MAYWVDGAWMKLVPAAGWLAWVEDEGACWLGRRCWSPIGGSGDATFDTIGIGGAAGDATNRLSVNAPATLLNHAGAGHQLKINKAAAGETASLLYQSDWSGRAEMGLAGNDDWSVKVSPDGASWITSLVVDSESAQISGEAFQSSAGDARPGLVLKLAADGGGAFGLGGEVANLVGEDDLADVDFVTGFYGYLANAVAGGPESTGYYHSLMVKKYRSIGGVEFLNVLSTRFTANPAYVRTWIGSRVGGPGNAFVWSEEWNGSNTAVDSNGFIKTASPIVRLFADRIEELVEPVGGSMTRRGVGDYTLSGVPPLAAQGWKIEVPSDHNGNRLVFVEVAYDEATETLTVTTSRPAWDASHGVWCGGEPVDIPEGRWVDLRFCKEADAGGEYPDPADAPEGAA